MNQSFTTIFKLISNQYSTFSEWVKFLISKVHGKKKTVFIYDKSENSYIKGK